MRLPDHDLELEGGVRCAAREIDARAWQAHLMKHPLGIHRSTSPGGRAPAWDLERWDAITPPVTDAARRDHVLARIASLSVAGLRCAVPEVRGRGTPAGDLECYACRPPLLPACAEEVGRDAVSERYAAVTTELLAALRVGSAVVVERSRLAAALMRLFREPLARFAPLVVLTLGVADRDAHPIARVTRGDGVRTELYRDGAVLTQWRTTHRSPPAHPNAAIGTLLDMAREPGRTPLSDRCVVSRPWWEAHAS